MSLAGNLKEQVEKYVQDVKQRYESCRDNEAATKARLIVPLFTTLGYDVANPAQCTPEYKANFGKNNKARKAVDWAFFVNDSLAFLVEAKAVGQKIRAHDEQLRIYYTEGQGVKLGILTTGVLWRFFTDLVAENLMDNEPFLEWDVLKDAIPYDFLTVLQREKFNPEHIEAFAKGKRRQSVLVAELTRLLEPSDEFVKFAIQNKEMLFENRNLNAKVIQEWKPILASAIHEWAQQQRLTAALDHAIDTQDEDQQHTGEPEVEYRDFWDPIRTEPNGLFAGKPAGGSWINKQIRGIGLVLVVHNHACRVELGFYKEDKAKRRDKALELFPTTEYPHELHDSDKCALVRFSVFDKGIKDRDHWPEIREKLTKLGTDIYNKLSNSEV